MSLPRTFGGVDADAAVDPAFWAWATSSGVEAIGCAPADVSEGWRVADEIAATSFVVDAVDGATPLRRITSELLTHLGFSIADAADAAEPDDRDLARIRADLALRRLLELGVGIGDLLQLRLERLDASERAAVRRGACS